MELGGMENNKSYDIGALSYELLEPEKKVEVAREDVEEGGKNKRDNSKGQIVYYRKNEEPMRREEYQKHERKGDADKEIATLGKVNWEE